MFMTRWCSAANGLACSGTGTHTKKKKTQTAFFRHGHTLSKMPTDTHIHRTAQYTFFFFLMLLLYSMHQSFDVFSEEAANVFVRCWRGAEDGLHRPHRMQSARIQTRVCVCSLLTRNVPVSNKKKKINRMPSASPYSATVTYAERSRY